ncbi:MAG TPA: NAD(P)-dependent oxidoreductase [Acidobacteriaceae bacterium]|jgi:nucleoside-diphosphate-sugar epimerase|nr:NAD(P)-dependent oxidoreductase [Acidobacteriaceae bacterium]
MSSKKVVITGAAGLVGQNLIPRLKERQQWEIIAIDKHAKNAATLQRLHPDVRVVVEDIASDGAWQKELEGCTHLVSAHAQIWGLQPEEFARNNVTATERLVVAARRNGVHYIVNISSSVVNSMAVDNYTETKKAQEAVIANCGIPQVIVRPTLMFGWFDRKHLGWLARFMQRTPVFPIPGNGRFLRQPLYAGDFADVVRSALEAEITGAYNITGQERISYIDLIRAVTKATGSRTRIVRIPYSLFWLMLRTHAMFNNEPMFTATQLKALTTPDVFEVIDWPSIFKVRATPLREALDSTFRDPTYSQIVLEP